VPALSPKSAPDAAASTASHPANVTIAIRPSRWDGMRWIIVRNKTGSSGVGRNIFGEALCPKLSPHLARSAHRRDALDMLRAARAIGAPIGKRYVVMGHSQGGSICLRRRSGRPRCRTSNCSAMSPSHRARTLPSASPWWRVCEQRTIAAYVLYTLGTYAKTNPAFDLARILMPTALSHMPDLMQGCMSHALSTSYWSTAMAEDQFLAKPEFGAFLAMAKTNEPGLLRIIAPTMDVQGTADVTVLPEATDKVAKELCAGGSRVTYTPVAGADHGGTMVEGGAGAQAWIDARFAGGKAASNCWSLPRRGSRAER
jgi:pimeloyl-ACP methyl ester carboxylesterase